MLFAIVVVAVVSTGRATSADSKPAPAPSPVVQVTISDPTRGLPAISADGAVIALPESLDNPRVGSTQKVVFAKRGSEASKSMTASDSLVLEETTVDDNYEIQAVVGLATTVPKLNARLQSGGFISLATKQPSAETGTGKPVVLELDGVRFGSVARPKAVLEVVATAAGKSVGKSAITSLYGSAPRVNRVAIVRSAAVAWAYLEVVESNSSSRGTHWEVMPLALVAPKP